MKSNDSIELRGLLRNLLPGLEISHAAVESGQRVVYFANFRRGAQLRRIAWGPVVVKVSRALNARQAAYLQKEIALLNSLNSRFYPRLHFHQVFTTDPFSGDELTDRVFISIEERVDAASLSEVALQFTEEVSVLGLIRQLVDALAILWTRPERIVHRDLKPANILVRNDNSIVVIDLGIVREEGVRGVTATFAPWGPCSPPYASPEQAKNDKKNISFKSDLFSIGTIAYELLAGSNPFFDSRRDTIEDVLRKVCTYHPPSLAQRGLASEEFSLVIETLMQKQPFERFRTIDLFRAALDSCGGGNGK